MRSILQILGYGHGEEHGQGKKPRKDTAWEFLEKLRTLFAEALYLNEVIFKQIEYLHHLNFTPATLSKKIYRMNPNTQFRGGGK